ncbi:MAG TPA: di-heme oxidoredictase family protein [Methylocystis sp.]
MKRALAVVSLLVLTAAAPFENAKLDGEAFSRPLPGLDAAQTKNFHAGSGLFRQAWMIGPSRDHPDVVGLGPLYNRLSCIACHVKNGRGGAPGDGGGAARAMVLRLSKPGVDRGAFGGPLPHPVYGAQLNPEGVPGVPGEGRAIVRYGSFESKLVDGTASGARWQRRLAAGARSVAEAGVIQRPRHSGPRRSARSRRHFIAFSISGISVVATARGDSGPTNL